MKDKRLVKLLGVMAIQAIIFLAFMTVRGIRYYRVETATVFAVRAEDMDTCIKQTLPVKGFIPEQAGSLKDLRGRLVGRVGVLDSASEYLLDTRKRVELDKGDLLWVLYPSGFVGYSY